MTILKFSAIALALALTTISCSNADSGGAVELPGGGPPVTGPIVVDDISYTPETITIKAGETVEWTWEGDLDHSVTANDDSFNSGIQKKGFTFEHTFDQAGVFGFYCLVHSARGGTTQNGVVVVEDA